MKASDYIAQYLLKAGCTHVFGFPGGAVTHIIDSLYQCPGIRFIGTYHEQAAAFAAEGYARMKNGIGVAVATSGPGATNLITGIGSAYFDSIPCLYLTGQVNTYEYKGDRKVRQFGFQETDIVSIVKPITKYAVRITDAHNIRYELEKAFSIASSGRKGPVLLDIPMDVQRAEVQERFLAGYTESTSLEGGFSVDWVIRQLDECSRPVILAGGGVRLSGAAAQLKRVAEILRIPVVSSLMGRDAFDNTSELYLGMIGTYGNRCANLALANSDLVLALGTRLDTRQTGTDPQNFAREAGLIRVDVDANELENRIKLGETAIQADVGAFLARLAGKMEQIQLNTDEWLSKVKDYRQNYPTNGEKSYPDPNHIMERISDCLGPRDAVCLDVGQNQMWAAQSLCITAGQRLLASGGMGAMGFALPCAIGAYYSGVGERVLAIAGDGGMQMNIQELALVKRNRIPIKVIVLNNRSLGMIRQFQEQYFDSRFIATVTDYAAPDFCAIANAYGIRSRRIACENDLSILKETLSGDDAVVIEIMLLQASHVYPKLSINRPIEEQEPLLERTELLMNMLIAPWQPGGQGEKKTTTYQQFIKGKFDRLKCKSADDALRLLPVRDDRGSHCAFLRPVTLDYRVALPGCAVILSRWRNENAYALSAEPFKATAESTERWLDQLVLARDDRILFLIVSTCGELIGHIGFSTFAYDEKSCEVDAVLRGEKDGHPGIMTFALRLMLQWGLEELKLEEIRLRVFSDNQRAIGFYLRNGFVAEKLLESDHPESGRRYLKMRLDLDAWKNANRPVGIQTAEEEQL